MMKRPYRKLDKTAYDALVNGSTILLCVDACTIGCYGTGDKRVFLMSGPSGQHKLAVVGTDLDRLNAHWKGFTDYNAAAAKLA